MVERFFANNQTTSVGSSPNVTLLSGPPCCGKTSLLFQFAYNCASESGRSVVFLCNKRKLESKPPLLSQGVDESSHVLHRIQMKYIEDDSGLNKYFAAFHLHGTFPAALVIDDFGDFFSDRNCQDRYGNPRGKDLAMVRTLALCRDAIEYSNKILHPSGSGKLLIADTHQGDIPRLLFIYKRWTECIFTVHGDGRGSFYLKTSSTTSNKFETTRVAKYSVALHHLQLEEILDE